MQLKEQKMQNLTIKNNREKKESYNYNLQVL